jgi:hypothetical protein
LNTIFAGRTALSPFSSKLRNICFPSPQTSFLTGTKGCSNLLRITVFKLGAATLSVLIFHCRLPAAYSTTIYRLLLRRCGTGPCKPLPKALQDNIESCFRIYLEAANLTIF